MKQARIALFGGSFNPPHIGHLKIAEAASLQFDLDEIRFLPTNISPLKQPSNAASATHRLEMTRLLVQNHPTFVVYSTEIDRGGISYTADTLRFFLSAEPTIEWFLLLGEDAFGSLENWREPDFIRTNVRIIVYPRTGVFHKLPDGVAGLRGELLGVSSSEIRARITSGKAVVKLVTEPVDAYIRQFGLYE